MLGTTGHTVGDCATDAQRGCFWNSTCSLRVLLSPPPYRNCRFSKDLTVVYCLCNTRSGWRFPCPLMGELASHRGAGQPILRCAMGKKDEKGFTLIELLIVVAIIL